MTHCKNEHIHNHGMKTCIRCRVMEDIISTLPLRMMPTHHATNNACCTHDCTTYSCANIDVRCTWSRLLGGLPHSNGAITLRRRIETQLVHARTNNTYGGFDNISLKTYEQQINSQKQYRGRCTCCMRRLLNAMTRANAQGYPC